MATPGDRHEFSNFAHAELAVFFIFSFVSLMYFAHLRPIDERSESRGRACTDMTERVRISKGFSPLSVFH